MNKQIFGIMVCKTKNGSLQEKGFYKTLQLLGNSKGFVVYVFYPDSVDYKTNQVKGFQFNFKTNQWKSNLYPIPDFIYDRCFYTSSKQFLFYKPFVQKLQQHTRFLGIGLKGKWEVYQILNQSIHNKYLPKTEIYESKTQLVRWLDHNPAILKPVGGSHGAGVIKISKNNHSYKIVGRDLHNNKIQHSFYSENAFLRWLRMTIRNKKYLIQDYLNLQTKSNQPFDIRVLIQKNKHGEWETLGMAARIGAAKNITSNLHGGGYAKSVPTLLSQEYDKEKAKEIEKEIIYLATVIPKYIEDHHGHLFEVGLDLGVDRSGRVWIIEVNSKPGRKVFSLLNDHIRRNKSLKQPIYYAEYLTKHS